MQRVGPNQWLKANGVSEADAPTGLLSFYFGTRRELATVGVVGGVRIEPTSSRVKGTLSHELM